MESENTALRDLQFALDKYGKRTFEFLSRVRVVGESIIDGLREHLGPDAVVVGVPPDGPWRTDRADYADAKFSFYDADLLLLEPVRIGIGLGIPNLDGDGRFWVRYVPSLRPTRDGVVLELPHQNLKIIIGERDSANPARFREVAAAIVAAVLETFATPENAAGAGSKGTIGFLKFAPAGA